MAAVIPNDISFTPLDVLTAAELNKLVENDRYLATAINNIIDTIYPVGTYYETSDSSFDPNISFGGTWVEDTAGRVLVAQNTGTFATVGDTGGEESHTLSIQEMPSHNHTQNAHSHWISNKANTYAPGTSAAYRSIASSGSSQNDYWEDTYTNSQQPAINNTGGGQAHNNLQPYIVIKRWHRTA